MSHSEGRTLFLGRLYHLAHLGILGDEYADLADELVAVVEESEL